MKVKIDYMSRQKQMVELAYKDRVRDRHDMAYLSMMLRLRSRKSESGMRSAELTKLPHFSQSFMEHGIIVHSYSFAAASNNETLSNEHIQRHVRIIENKIKHSKNMFANVGMPLYCEQIPEENHAFKAKIESFRHHNSMKQHTGDFQVSPGYVISSVNGYNTEEFAYVSACFYMIPMVEVETKNNKVYWYENK